MPSSFRSPRWSTLTLVGLGALAASLGLWAGRSSSASRLPPADARATSSPTVVSGHNQPAHDNAPAGSWAKQWDKLKELPSTPKRDQELAELLETLAKSDPQLALKLALAEGNWRLRDTLRNAVLRGWGAVAPDAAVDWAMGHRLDVRMQCVAAALTGAAANPSEAVRVALRVCKADPEPAADYGHALITALVENTGAFQDAARFAATVGTDRQQQLLDSAFYQWARHQPDQASAAIAQIADPVARAAAHDGLLAGWASVDPTKLAAHAQLLPSQEERSRALAVALPRWAEKDAAGAAEWLGRFDPGAEFDAGIATVATSRALIAQAPRTAMEWTESITDRAQRLITQHEVITQWAQRDPRAARQFAETVKNPDAREMMIEALSSLTPQK